MKPCRRCGGEKDPAKTLRGSPLCENCRGTKIERERAHTVCERDGCDNPKRPGQGAKLCEAHHAESLVRYPKEQTPCRKCGKRENKERGKQLCRDCKEAAEWQMKTRRKAKKAMNRKRCAGCGELKGPGSRRRYCDKCEAKRQDPRRVCNRCGELKLLAKWAKTCEDCKEKAAKIRRERQNAYARKIRQDPERRERLKAQQRKAKKKKSSRERENERARMRYRMKAMREGRTIKPAKLGRENISVPVAPVLPFVRAWITAYNVSSDHDQDVGGQKELARRSGLSEKRIYEVLNGAENVARDTADALCQAVGVHYSILYADIEATKKGARAA